MSLKNRISSYFDFGKRALNSKDGKTLAKNFTYLSLLQIAGYVFPFITMPYLSRVIGVDGFGKIAFASAIIVWVQTIVDWGFGFSATREVARNRDNKVVLSSIYSNVIWTKFFLAFICGLVLCVLIVFIPLLKENALILLFTFLLIPGHILFPDWFFQGMEEMKYTTIFNLSIKLAFTIAIFFVIKNKEDYIYQPLLTSVGYMVSGVISYRIIKKKWGIRLHRPDLKSSWASLKGSFDIFIGNLFPTMYNNFSALLLGAIGTPTDIGLYDGGNKFVNIVQQFIAVIGRTFYPFLNRRSDKHTVYARINLLAAGTAAIALFFTSPLLVRIFLTPEFNSSIVVMRIMSISLFFMALGTVYCVNYLFVKGLDREARNITIISSLVGLALAYPFIYWYGFIGAAINVTLTRGIMGVLYMITAKRHSKQCK